MPPTTVLVRSLHSLVLPHPLLHIEREHIDLVSKVGRKNNMLSLGISHPPLDLPAHRVLSSVLPWCKGQGQLCSCREYKLFPSYTSDLMVICGRNIRCHV